jgi:hypothetical protein
MVPRRAERGFRPGPCRWLPLFSAAELAVFEAEDPEGYATYVECCELWYWACRAHMIAGWALLWLVPAPGEVIMAAPATAGPPPPEVLDRLAVVVPLGPPRSAPEPRYGPGRVSAAA